MKKLSVGMALLGMVTIAGCKSKQKAELEPVPPPPEPAYVESVEFESVQVVPVEPVPIESPSAGAATGPPAAGAPATYVIRKGDTLWSIARRHYGDGQRWQDIVQANPGVDPKWLRVGQSIILP